MEHEGRLVPDGARRAVGRDRVEEGARLLGARPGRRRRGGRTLHRRERLQVPRDAQLLLGRRGRAAAAGVVQRRAVFDPGLYPRPRDRAFHLHRRKARNCRAVDSALRERKDDLRDRQRAAVPGRQAGIRRREGAPGQRRKRRARRAAHLEESGLHVRHR